MRGVRTPRTYPLCVRHCLGLIPGKGTDVFKCKVRHEGTLKIRQATNSLKRWDGPLSGNDIPPPPPQDDVLLQNWGGTELYKLDYHLYGA
ncbi:hypothetical protein TNCV_3164131 [Trichonephila clavipes]|nr:hypothetical protein TNCV_3164131 [Trichonephila clavipes]